MPTEVLEPRVEAKPAGPEEAADDRPVVLAVDDEPSVLSALRRLLRREPYHLVTAENPEEALQWVNRCEIGLLLADQRMPNMTGTELVRALHERSPETPAVILTGYADIGWLTEAINEARIQRLVHKPWNGEELRQIIRGLLQERGKRWARPRPRGTERPEPETGHEETIVYADCRGKTSGQVLQQILPILAREGGADEHVILLLDHLEALSDSVMSFLKEFAREVPVPGVRTCLVDPSGYADAFFRVMREVFPHLADGLERPPRAMFPARVLLAERDDASREVLRTLICGAGHTCETACCGAEVIQRLYGGSFDLVILDLPEKPEMELEEHIARQGTPALSVTVTTRLGRCGEATFSRVRLRRRRLEPYCVQGLFDGLKIC